MRNIKFVLCDLLFYNDKNSNHYANDECKQYSHKFAVCKYNIFVLLYTPFGCNKTKDKSDL